MAEGDEGGGEALGSGFGVVGWLGEGVGSRLVRAVSTMAPSVAVSLPQSFHEQSKRSGWMTR